MSFTYSDALLTDGDRVRLEIGDTEEGHGPKPRRKNFSNEEITSVLTSESDRINGAVAHCFEILAAAWTSYAISKTERKSSTNGDNKEDGELTIDAKLVADNYRKQAAIWRAKPGGASEAERSGGLITMTRTDAYSDTGEYV